MSHEITITDYADTFTVHGDKDVSISFSAGHRKDVLIEVELIITADMLRDIVAETSSVHD